MKEINIFWQQIFSADDPLWNENKALYLYLHPDKDEVLYAGKVYGQKTSVAKRWNAKDKLAGFWPALEEQRGIFEHLVLVGVVSVVGGRRSAKLNKELESLLIKLLRPWGNITENNDKLPNCRPRLLISCHGDWPFEQQMFQTLLPPHWMEL